jgi:hypothetical protein
MAKYTTKDEWRNDIRTFRKDLEKGLAGYGIDEWYTRNDENTNTQAILQYLMDEDSLQSDKVIECMNNLYRAIKDDMGEPVPSCLCTYKDMCLNVINLIQPIDWTAPSGKKFRKYIPDEKFLQMFPEFKEAHKEPRKYYDCQAIAREGLKKKQKERDE